MPLVPFSVVAKLHVRIHLVSAEDLPQRLGTLGLPEGLSEPLPHGDIVRYRDGLGPFPCLGGRFHLRLLLGSSLPALPRHCVAGHLGAVGQGGSGVQAELLL